MQIRSAFLIVILVFITLIGVFLLGNAERDFSIHECEYLNGTFINNNFDSCVDLPQRFDVFKIHADLLKEGVELSMETVFYFGLLFSTFVVLLTVWNWENDLKKDEEIERLKGVVRNYAALEETRKENQK